MSEGPQVLGVYSYTKRAEAGTGSTVTEFMQKTYWFALRVSDEQIEVQPLNGNHVPSGIVKLLSKGEFVRDYEPEVEYYQKNTIPHMRSLKEKVEKGEEFFQEGNFNQAEAQFIKALVIDPDNARANLGLGSVYCETRNYEKIKGIFDKIIINPDTFKKELSQQFNRFAVGLRKNKQYDEAILFYDKAITVNQEDENLYFNTARAYFEKGDFDEAISYLEAALRINPGFVEAHKFIRYCQKHAAARPNGQDDLDLPDITVR